VDLLQLWPPHRYVRGINAPVSNQGVTKRESLMCFPGRAWTRLLLACLLLSGTAFVSVPSRADEFTSAQRAEIIAIIRDAMKRDPSILRDAVVALQADDAEREKSAARGAVLAAKDDLVTPNDPVAGNRQGSVTIVEFFDVRCPYCRKLEPEMADFLASDHDVRLVYKDLPILGPASVLGTKALLAARKQDGYLKLRDALMRMPPDITRAAIEAAATKLGLDSGRLLHDMDDPSIQRQIDANLRLAERLNIEGTPAMVIGNDLLAGAVDTSELQDAVAKARSAKD
jgi:protein-disulfide isomerase